MAGVALTNAHITQASALALRPDASARYPLFAVLTTVVVLAWAFMLAADTQSELIRENGPIESLSAVLFLGAALVLLPAGLRVWPFTVLVFACGLRELDLDKSLWTEGLLKSRQYVGETVPLGERLVAFAVLTALMTTIGLAVRRGLKNAGTRIRNTDGVMLCVLAGLGLALATKSLDGLPRKLTALGVETGEAVSHLAAIIEEVGEFGMALCFLCAALAYQHGTGTARAAGGVT